MFKTFKASAILLLGICFMSASIADETNVKSNQAKIQSESNESYAALGVRVGAFMIYPTLESANDWNDNIYSSQNNERSDFIFHVKPGLKIKSNWSRHSLNLSAGSDDMFYKNHSKEDKNNYFADINGRFDVLKDSFATAKLYYQHNAEDRGSPNPIASVSVKPLENDTLGGKVGYEHKINRIRANVSNDIQYKKYIDGVDAFNKPVLNSQRTRMVNTSEARLGYELFSGYEAYVKGSYNFVDYKKRFISQGNLDRSSKGYIAATGLAFDISHTMVGDAYVGYANQNYKDPRLKSVKGITGGLTLTWLPTQLTTVKAGVDRSIQETTQVGLSGFFSTVVTASVDHELMRNLLLNAHASYTNNDYIGTNPLNRKEDLYSAGFKVKYLLSRYLYLQSGYDYKTRAVNIDGSDYNINNAYFNIGTQM